MSVSDTVNAIQAVNRVVAGISTAPDLSAYPDDLTDAMLPAALTFPADMSWGKQDHQLFVVVVYAFRPGQGTAAQMTTTCLDLLEAMRNAWRAVGGVNGYALIREPGPKGFGPRGTTPDLMNYYGHKLYGFDFGLPLLVGA